MKPTLESELMTAETALAPQPGSRPAAPGEQTSGTLTRSGVSVREGAPVAASRLAGRYELLALLGAGAMGSVYRAHDLELDEVVALKMLRPDLLQSEALLALFRREVKLSRRVAHPNVARVFDLGEHEGRRFLTMELVVGEPLGDLLGREGRLSVQRTVRLGLGIGAGLAAAHEAGIVHRDLKPDNVMIVAQDGRPVVMDFGVARAVSNAGDPTATTGTIVGTPAYMAPEQVEASRDLDGRADIYAFGVMLFELLTGELPFQGDSALAVAARRLTHDPPDPRALRAELPEALSALVLRCLARRPAERVQSVEELTSALTELALDIEVESLRPATPASPASPPRAMERGRRVAVLPLTNTGPKEDDYVAAGLTEDLVDNLSTLPGLRLRPLAMAARFAGAEVDPCEAGRQLGVEVVVTGSVRRRGDALRITARVVSVADGFQLWAERYERPAAEALHVSDELTTRVASSLTVTSGPREGVETVDPVAIDLYLRGRAEASRGYPALLEALTLLAEAHERMPHDQKILATYARTAAKLCFFVTDADESLRLAVLSRELADRVMALAPDLPDSNVVQAYVSFSAGEFAEAVRLLTRVSARAPSLVDAHELLGRILVETGPVEAGLAALDRALSLDPSLQSVHIDRARTRALLGDHQEAERELLASPASRPAAFALLSRFMLWGFPTTTTLAELREEIKSGPLTGPHLLLNLMVEVLETETISPEHEAMVRSVVDLPGRARRGRVFVLQCLAEGQLFRGDTEGALDYLEAALPLGFVDVVWLDHCPLLLGLRSHPRYIALHAQVTSRLASVHAAYAGA